jgi:hypothetical protein
VQSQRARFTSATMKRDETVEEFAERLRELACGLPETTTDAVLLQRLRDGLPSALKVSALAVSGEFNEGASQVGQIADVMAAARPRREPVNMIGGAGGRKYGKVEGTRRTGGTGDVEWALDRARPRGSRENLVVFNHDDPEDVRLWNRARKCYRCQQWRHIWIGGTQECGWPEVGSGNGREGGAAGASS